MSRVFSFSHILSSLTTTIITMDDNHSISLVGAMDCLWFHQIVLFTQPMSLLNISSSSATTCRTTKTSKSCALTCTKDDLSLEDEEKEVNQNSSSQSIEDSHKNVGYSSTVRRLHKTMSCKSLGELEFEEVKGFIDLGFIFNKEELNPKMLSLVPGLQRLNKNDHDENNTDKIRPYLSEAWLIRRHKSPPPLLNLRVPRTSTDVDMKKHIKFWARAVVALRCLSTNLI